MHGPWSFHFQASSIYLDTSKALQHGLQYTSSPFTLQAFSDIDWTGYRLDRKSTIGFCVYLGHNPIIWDVKKHPIVAKSSTEAEYGSLATMAA